jgi:hypothetical protein
MNAQRINDCVGRSGPRVHRVGLLSLAKTERRDSVANVISALSRMPVIRPVSDGIITSGRFRANNQVCPLRVLQASEGLDATFLRLPQPGAPHRVRLLFGDRRSG